MKQFLGILLTFALLLSLMPGMSMEVRADNITFNPASNYTGFGSMGDDTVKIDGVQYSDGKSFPSEEWYVIGYNGSDKTVTLLSKLSFASKAFNSSGTGNSYETSEIKGFVESLTDTGQPLAGIKDALANISVEGEPEISGAVPYLLSTAEASRLSDTQKTVLSWWLRSPYVDDNNNIMYGIG